MEPVQFYHKICDVYSISGFFIEGHTPSQPIYFVGGFYVKTNPKVSRDKALAIPFEGSLDDCYGESEINGEISPTGLAFQKKYVTREDIIQYCFQKNEQGIWVGEYSGNNMVGKGCATAKTNLDWPEADVAVNKLWKPRSFEDLLPEE